MADERQYVIPLRKGFQKKPRWKRTNAAVRTLRTFLSRHTKADRIVIGKFLNQKIWQHGGKNPPPRVQVSVLKQEKVAYAEVPGKPYPTPKEKSKEEAKGLLGKLGMKGKEKKEEMKIVAREESLEEKKPEVKKEIPVETKPVEKKEEMKKETPKAELKPAEKKETPKAELKPAEKKEAQKAETKTQEKKAAAPEAKPEVKKEAPKQEQKETPKPEVKKEAPKNRN